MTTIRCFLLFVASAVFIHASMQDQPYPRLHKSFDPALQSALETSLKKEFEPKFLNL